MIVFQIQKNFMKRIDTCNVSVPIIFKAFLTSSVLALLIDIDHLDEIFLIPIILKELSGIKRSWTIAEHEFVSLLAAKGKSLWRDTLDNLRALWDDEDLPEFHMLPVALLAWHRLGTLIGIHRVLEPIVGCCYASCPEFAKPFDWPLGRCSGCRQVQYCGNECQNK